jgi:hypothetical protein
MRNESIDGQERGRESDDPAQNGHAVASGKKLTHRPLSVALSGRTGRRKAG